MSEYLPIETMWESYRKDVVPDDALETQVISHQAFVCGACALFWLIMMTSDASDRDGLAIMDAIHREIESIGKEAINEFLKTMPVGGSA